MPEASRPALHSEQEQLHETDVVSKPQPETLPAHANDADLVQAAQQGELAAFNRLVERHQQAVFSVCMRLLRDVQQAEDAAQDTFVRAWNAIDRFQGPTIVPWLLRIATNRAYDMLRTSARRPASSLDAELYEVEPEWTSQATPAEPPESFTARRELSGYLEQALDDLPADQRLAVVLSDVQGYGYEEIATITDVSIGTVKSRISRGRSKLRQALKGHERGREHFEQFERSS